MDDFVLVKFHLLFCLVVAKDRVADKEVPEGSNGHRNKLVPTVLEKCWENVGKMLGKCWESVEKNIEKVLENVGKPYNHPN